MITDNIINLLVGFLHAIFSLLPTGNLDSIFGLNGGLHIFSQLGGYISSGWDTWLPLTETLGMLSITVNIILPAIIVYKLANWTWRHIPDLWGFGPGAG